MRPSPERLGKPGPPGQLCTRQESLHLRDPFSAAAAAASTAATASTTTTAATSAASAASAASARRRRLAALHPLGDAVLHLPPAKRAAAAARRVPLLLRLRPGVRRRPAVLLHRRPAGLLHRRLGAQTNDVEELSCLQRAGTRHTVTARGERFGSDEPLLKRPAPASRPPWARRRASRARAAASSQSPVLTPAAP